MSAASADLPSQRLPLLLTPLIGREREVAELRVLLCEAGVRLLTLTGTGGAGKTRLAIAVAEQVGDTFSDGVAFVSLAPIVDPELVVSAIAQALGVRESGERSLQESLTIYLQSKHLLLILDNFEHLRTAAPLVSDLLAACSALLVLATSRSLLHLYGEHDYLVPPLSLPDLKQLPPFEQLHEVGAISLFAARAQAARTGFALTPENAPAIAAICARLDGLPLAIELAAARVRLLSPQALLARLEHRLHVLTGGPRDVPERQQTMRNTIAWSYALLTAEQQALLRQLTVFAGGWTLEAADAVCDIDASIFDELSLLIDQCLIRQIEQPDGSTRFGMLETIREFALEQFEASNERIDVYQRHEEYFLALAEQAEPEIEGPHASTWLRQLEDEHDNLRGALERTLARGDAEMALRFGAALWWYWGVHGYPLEGWMRLEAALALPMREPSIARANALDGASWITVFYARDYDRAEQLADECLAVSRKIGYDLGVAAALHDLGRVAQQRGAFERARECYGASLAHQRGLGIQGPRYSSSLGNLGNLALVQGDLVQAAMWLEESVSVDRERGDTPHLALALGDLGAVVLEQGDVACAAGLLRESLALNRDLGDRRSTPNCLEGLATIAIREGHVRRATRLYGAANALRASIGYPRDGAAQAHVEHDLAAIQTTMSADAFVTAWDEGQVMPLDEAIVQALADDVVHESATRDVCIASLSRREIEVLRLIVEGKADKEIAATLSISPHTVMRHVHNILVKLDLPSRTAVATWAMRNGLA